jgi:type II secretory pathway predicted ATPase ExeA
VRLRDLEEFEKRMDLRFQLVDMRFEQIDHRFHNIDQRFEQIDHRFDTVATKDDLALVHVQMNGLSRDINRLNRGFAVLVGGMISGFAAVMVLLIQLNMNISQL